MIKAVFFDLGSTLIHNGAPWDEYFHQGDNAMTEVFRQNGINIPEDALFHKYGTFLDQYYSRLGPGNPREVTVASAIAKILKEHGYPDVEEDIIRAAIKAMYAVINTNWLPEADALPTLKKIAHAGFQLGLISNTADDAHVQALIDQHGFRPYFDFIITSAALGYRKPDPRIFTPALDHFNLEPQEAAMVGDTKDADILGANRLGMFSIWITRRASTDDRRIVPKATVDRLDQIPILLKDQNKKAGSH